ncbi:MAG: EamA family transporter [Nanoarchaeota archaeon]|nr:EamA family transporter [Nanoarchaeota archaeon]
MEHKRKAILIILTSVLLISVAQLLLKYGVKNATAGLTDSSASIMLAAIFSSWQVLMAVALLLASSTLWLIGLSKADLSFAAPMLGTGYAVVAFFSWVLFNETLGITRIFGIIIIITGVIMMSRS